MPASRRLASLLLLLLLQPLVAVGAEPPASPRAGGKPPARALAPAARLDAEVLGRLKAPMPKAAAPTPAGTTGAERSAGALEERWRAVQAKASLAEQRGLRRYFPWLEKDVGAIGALRERAARALAAPPGAPGAAEEYAAATAAFLGATAAFQERFAASVERLEDDAFRPTVLVVSGGTSLGSYEAGLIHYVERFLEAKERAVGALAGAAPGRPPPRSFSVVTGASAGALNAFLAALSACLAPPARPEDAKAFLWTRIGLGALLQPVEPNACRSPGGAFSRTEIERSLDGLRRLWSDGTAWRDCDVQFGLSVARVEPRRIPVQAAAGAVPESAVRLYRTTESFTFRLQRRGAGAPSFVLDAPAWSEFRAEPGDRTGADDRRVDVGTVLELLKASSGIPLVFNPVRIPYTHGDSGSPSKPVFERDACFMDGGIFDNVPLSTAMRLAEAAAQAGADGAKAAGSAAPPAPLPPYFLYVDPDNVADAPEGGAGGGEREGVLAQLGGIAGGVVNSARQAELLKTLEVEARERWAAGCDDPEGARCPPSTRERLLLPERQHPVTGAMLGSFGAFTDASFRIFDFFAGMADARTFLEERSLVFASLPAAEREALVESELFRCFEAAWTNDERLDALPACQRLLAAAPGPAPVGAIAPATQRSVLRLLEMARAEGATATFASPTRFFAELARPSPSGATFQFADLDDRGHPAKAGEGLEAVRERYERIAARLAGRMDGILARTGVRTGASTAFDALLVARRTPFYGSLAAVDRGLDAALGWQLFRSPWDAVVGVRAFQLCAECGDALLAGNLMTYALLKHEWGVGAVHQLQLGAGPAWRLAFGDVLSGEAAIDLQGTWQLFRRFFLSADYNLQPWAPKGPSRYDFTLGLGVRLW